MSGTVAMEEVRRKREGEVASLKLQVTEGTRMHDAALSELKERLNSQIQRLQEEADQLS